MAISRRAKFVRWLTGRYMQNLDVPNVPVAEAREHIETAARMLSRRARGVETRFAKLAGIDVDWLHPKEARKDKVVYYLHGGAYVLGSRSTHRKLAGHIAKTAGIVAVVPEYRLAPEHPFPAGIEDFGFLDFLVCFFISRLSLKFAIIDESFTPRQDNCG